MKMKQKKAQGRRRHGSSETVLAPASKTAPPATNNGPLGHGGQGLKHASIEDIAKVLRTECGATNDAPRGRAALWIGAGCSASAGIPLANDMAGELAARLANLWDDRSMEFDAALPMHRDEAVKFLCSQQATYAKARETGDLYFVLFEELGKKEMAIREFIRDVIRKTADRRVNWAHLCIGELVRMKLVHTILTTNFDDLALRGLVAAGEYPAVIDDVEFLNRLDPTPPVAQLVHLHGHQHVYRPRNTPEDLGCRIPESTDERLRNLLAATRCLIVVGYNGSVREQIMLILRRALDDLGDPPHVFWVTYGAEPSVIAGELLAADRARRRLVPDQDADAFFQSLLRSLGKEEPTCVAEAGRLELERALALRTGIVRSGRATPSQKEIMRAHFRYRDRAQRAAQAWAEDPVDLVAELSPEDRLAQLDKVPADRRTAPQWKVSADLHRQLGDKLLASIPNDWLQFASLPFGAMFPSPEVELKLQACRDHWARAINDAERTIESMIDYASTAAPMLYGAIRLIDECSHSLYDAARGTSAAVAVVERASQIILDVLPQIPSDRAQAFNACETACRVTRICAVAVSNLLRSGHRGTPSADSTIPLLLERGRESIRQAMRLGDGFGGPSAVVIREDCKLMGWHLDGLDAWAQGDSIALAKIDGLLESYDPPFEIGTRDFETARRLAQQYRKDTEAGL